MALGPAHKVASEAALLEVVKQPRDGGGSGMAKAKRGLQRRVSG